MKNGQLLLYTSSGKTANFSRFDRTVDSKSNWTTVKKGLDRAMEWKLVVLTAGSLYQTPKRGGARKYGRGAGHKSQLRAF